MHGCINNPGARRPVSACATPALPVGSLSLTTRCAGMRSGSLHANGLRPLSVAQYDKIGTNVTISVSALSVIIDYHPSGVQSLPPSIRTCVTLSVIQIRSLLSSLFLEACTPEPGSSCTNTHCQPLILLVQSNTREALSHLSNKAFVLSLLL